MFKINNSLYFQSLTSGVDSLIQQKKTELEGLKQESYFQRKKAKTEEEESKEKGAKKKKWINLDSAGFDDFDGTISGEEEEQLKAGKKFQPNLICLALNPCVVGSSLRYL
jgi:hypothetical protein